jgi:NAD(P)-dependent dehydrogenase (short-subunit alcohol dehydrogenase family)
MGQFDGKVLVVTGGGRGIGAATAIEFVRRGGRVALGDVVPEIGHETVEVIGKDNAVFVETDVRDPAACQALVDAAVERFGGVDYLVNSAIKMAPGPLADLKLEDWKLVMDTGLTGTFLMTQAVGRWLIANKRPGAVVNLSSMAGFQPYGASGAYSTVKAALLMLGEHFAIEWASTGVHTLPVDAGALHDHELDLQLVQPRGQGAAVALEPAELPTVLVDRAVGLLDQHGDDVQHAVHIDAGHAAVQGGKSFHQDAPVSKVPSGTQERHLWPVRCTGELEDSSNRNRFGPLYRTCCHRLHGNGAGSATVGGTSQLGGGPVRHRGRAFIRIATSSRLRATSHGAPTQGFHARGRVGRLMIG